MSGAEIAGIVLGAIPLLISGLEHYGHGVRTIRKIRHSSREFARLRRTLETENAIFLNSLEILLKDDVHDQTLAELLADVSNTSRWSQPSLDKCLQRRLGRSYVHYFAAVKDMQDAIAEFGRSLEIDANGKGPFDQSDKWSVSIALKRAKFGLKMNEYSSLMNEVTASNQRIYQLTTQNSTLEPIRQSRRKVPDLERSRKHAHDVFAALQRGLRGSCGAGHRASLYMRPVTSRQARVLENKRHRVVLHHHPAVTAHPLTSPTWSVEEAELGLLDEESDDDVTTNSFQGTVRFQIDQNESASQQYQNLQEIHDLCTSLQQLRATRPSCDFCLGYLANPSKKGRHGIFWPRRPFGVQATATALSLDQVLDPQNGHRLTESDKKRLALALASGMLRLYNTPWLEEQWGKREVILYTRSGNLLAAHPFVSRDMTLAQAQTPSPPGARYFEHCDLIVNQTTFALGILLIEIAFGQPFETLRGASSTGDGFADFLAAHRLVDDVYPVAGARYGDAVRRCIRNDFDHLKCTLGDAAYRQKVYDGVVAVLEQDVLDDEVL